MQKIKVINNISELLEFKERWDELYKKLSDKLTPFQSFDYIYNSWKYMLSDIRTNKLFIPMLFDSSTDVVDLIIPLYIDNKGTLRFINDIHTDFCDGLLGADYNYTNLKKIFETILSEKLIKNVRFINLLPQSQILSYGKHFLGWSSVVYSYTEHSYLTMEKTEDFFSVFKHLTSSQKSELKRIIKLNSNSSYYLLNSKKDLFPIEEFNVLKNSMIKRKVRARHFFQDNLIKVIESLYHAGMLDIAILKCKKENITEAMSFIMSNGTKDFFMFWIDLYSGKKLINIYSYLQSLEHILKKKDMTISFGRGAYPYKVQNFQPIIQNLYNVEYTKDFWKRYKNYSLLFRLFVKSLIRRK